MATTSPNLCPSCGAARPSNAPRGLCPRCLMREGLDSEAEGLSSARTAASTVDLNGPTSMLDSLAASLGSFPRVLLRDTDPASEPPIQRPGSPEMPAPADRSVRLRLLGEIARGGMGAVLKGRDEDLGRDLAVKVLLEKHRHNPELVRRFVEEAQIGGQLQHPGVVPIYELGTFADRRPYFAMKLVKGQTLSTLLAGRAAPADGLSRYLGIFEQVCQTVAYAHARGVIHRDLKPSNVMVGGFGEVQVMDWGLAKVLPRGGVADDERAGRDDEHETIIATARSGADSDHSRAGSVMGTPSYMAPEQARGEVKTVDERADVFALGSILCELLTGSPAFVGRAASEIQRKAARGDTAEALERLAACAADAELVALCRECLAVEPEDRPRDAGVVAEKVLSYRRGVERRLREAELARVEAQARAEEERKRRRVEVGLAASLLALVLVGGGVTAWVVQQRQHLVNRVELAIGQATERRDLARTNPDDPGRWAPALEAARRAEALVEDGGPATLRHRVRDLVAELQSEAESAERSRRLLEKLADIRAARIDEGLAATDAAYASAFRSDGLDLDRATPKEAADAVKKLAIATSNGSIALAAALDDWAAVRREGGAEIENWQRLLAVSRLVDPDPYRDEIRTILSETDLGPKLERLRTLALDPKAELLPPASASLLARALVASGDTESAIDLLRRSQNRHPDDFWVNFDLAGTLVQVEPPRAEEAIPYFNAARAVKPSGVHWLGHVLSDLGRGAEAADVFRDLEARQSGEPAHAVCLGRTLHSLGREPEARAALERAVAAARAAIRQRPDDPPSHHHLGMALHGLGNLDEAIAEFREAIRLSPRFEEPRNDLGVALMDAQRPDEAVAAFREALRINPHSLPAGSNLATSLQYEGKNEEAVAAFRDLVRRFPQLAGLRYNLGNALERTGAVEESIDAYREALKLDPEHIEARINLGIRLGQAGRLDEAIATLREATRRRPESDKAWSNLATALGKAGSIDGLREAIETRPDVPELHTRLAQLLIDQGRSVEAIPSLRTIARLEPEHPGTWYQLGEALSKAQEFEAASESYREAIRLHPDNPEAREALGLALFQAGRTEEAIDAYRESIRRNPERANGHYGRATIDLVEGRLDPAIAGFREAVQLDPEHAEAHCNLGLALQARGDYTEAAIELRKGHELGSRRPGWPYASADWAAEAERLARLADRLPEILNGTAELSDDAERLEFARMAYDTRHFAATARLLTEAFEHNPKLADDPEAGHRYHAARAAVLVVAGLDDDQPRPDIETKNRLRHQALDWLRADLDAWRKKLDTATPDAKHEVAQALRLWQTDPKLASVRDLEPVDPVPDEELEAWRALWKDVADTLKRTEAEF